MIDNEMFLKEKNILISLKMFLLRMHQANKEIVSFLT